MRLHFIVHEDFEAPGVYEIWGKMNNFKNYLFKSVFK